MENGRNVARIVGCAWLPECPLSPAIPPFSRMKGLRTPERAGEPVAAGRVHATFHPFGGATDMRGEL